MFFDWEVFRRVAGEERKNPVLEIRSVITSVTKTKTTIVLVTHKEIIELVVI